MPPQAWPNESEFPVLDRLLSVARERPVRIEHGESRLLPRLLPFCRNGYNNPMLPMVGLYWALTLGFYSAVAFAIWRLFQIGREVSEIKRLLMDIRAHQTLPR